MTGKVKYVCPHCGVEHETEHCPKCGAKLDKHGKCPALCAPVAAPLPTYDGPAVIGLTHLGRMARGHE